MLYVANYYIIVIGLLYSNVIMYIMHPKILNLCISFVYKTLGYKNATL